MTFRPFIHITVAASLVFAVAACGKKGDGGNYGCEIFIKKKTAAPVEGRASDADAATATEAAWKNVCSKLAAADQPDCRNKDKWSPAISNGSMTMNGKTTSTVTIKLQQDAPQLKGKGKSTTSQDDACKQATEAACKQAGASGDCVAAGGFEQQGKSTESSTGSM